MYVNKHSCLIFEKLTRTPKIYGVEGLKINLLRDTYIAKSARYYAEVLNGKSDARWKGRKERPDFAFRVVFAIWNTCVSRCARGGAGDVIEGRRAFESRRLCWMCGGASINSYWFRCRLRTPPPRLPFLLSSSVTERQPYRQLRIILIAFESRPIEPGGWCGRPRGTRDARVYRHENTAREITPCIASKRNSHINTIARFGSFMFLIIWYSYVAERI